MKAVILAAGQGKRMQPLTLSKPKPLLRVANTPIIRHNLNQLQDIIDEAIIVIGYKGDMIQKHLGERIGNIKITYVEQKHLLGTGHALMQVQKYFEKERFIVMMGDDIYYRGDMRRCLRYPLAVMARRVENYSDFGVFINKEEKVLDLVEKPQKFVSDLANAAFYVFNESIFEALKKINKSSRGEIELTDGLKQLALEEDIFSIEAKAWMPIVYPWNLLEADQIVRDGDIKAGRKTIINGKVSNSSIGDNCRIEGFVKNSIIGDNVIIHVDSVVEDSIIGDNVQFTGTIKSAERLEIKTGNNLILAENFGAVIGNNAVLYDVLLQPGTFVWPKVHKKNAELKGIVKR